MATDRRGTMGEPQRERVARIPLRFGNPERPLFGWLHAPSTAVRRARGVVVCSSIGYEYVLTHRTIRHLSDRLARAGFPTLRFDYDGTGDSAGDDADPGRLRAWTDSIHEAVDALGDNSEVSEVVLAGIRFGGTLALLAAGEKPVHGLVLWASSASGKQFARETRVLAMSTSFADGGSSSAFRRGDLDAAGFMLSRESLEDMSAIDLRAFDRPPAHRALIVARDDVREDPLLPDCLRNAGVEVECRQLPGYLEMMDEPHFSRLPHEVMESIEEWVARDAPPAAGDTRVPAAPQAAAFSYGFSSAGADPAEHTAMVQERAVTFGPENGLFGVLCGPWQAPANPGPTVLLLNTGCVHHIGSNRVYVSIARRLATLGVVSLRFDIAGLGDSPATLEQWENHPYAPNLEQDTVAAMDYLHEAHKCREFILAGLCSGAYAAYRGALRDDRVVETIMINPLTFQWKEGMTLKTPPHQHYADVSQYRRSIKSWSSWKKMLSGQADLRKIMAVSTRQAGHSARGYARGLMPGRGEGGAGDDLSGNLERIAAAGRHVTFIFAAGDPGMGLLHTEARGAVRNLLKKDALTLEVVAGADHTFTPPAARQLLVDQVVERVTIRGRRGGAGA